MPRARSPAASFARLLDGAATVIYLVDDERQIVYCNAACASWLGVAADQLIGTRCGYHSPTEGSASLVAAAGLCPPPEVFTGQRLQATIATPHNASSLATDFLPIRDDSDEVALVLAIGCSNTGEPAGTSQDSDDALHETVRRFRHSQSSRYRVDTLIGRSPQIVRARRQTAIAIDCAANVLIVGPAGSGKDHVARTIHNRGGDPSGPLVPLACATLGAGLLISTLAAAVNSHRRKTSEALTTGTLLLSDVDALPVDAHAEFSRLLSQEHTSLQTIATASGSLQPLVAKAEFREDLACTLAEVEIHLPPLADRLDDLPLLAQLFLEEINATGGKQLSSLTTATLDLLAAHTWPGNLDELASVVAEAHGRATGPQIMPRDLPQRIQYWQEATRGRRADEAIDLEDFLGRVETELIARALARARGNKTRAAKLLGMTRPRFYRRLVQLKLLE